MDGEQRLRFELGGPGAREWLRGQRILRQLYERDKATVQMLLLAGRLNVGKLLEYMAYRKAGVGPICLGLDGGSE